MRSKRHILKNIIWIFIKESVTFQKDQYIWCFGNGWTHLTRLYYQMTCIFRVSTQNLSTSFRCKVIFSHEEIFFNKRITIRQLSLSLSTYFSYRVIELSIPIRQSWVLLAAANFKFISLCLHVECSLLVVVCYRFVFGKMTLQGYLQRNPYKILIVGSVRQWLITYISDILTLRKTEVYKFFDPEVSFSLSVLYWLWSQKLEFGCLFVCCRKNLLYHFWISAATVFRIYLILLSAGAKIKFIFLCFRSK